MRLWHIDLIPYLPRTQLLAQWRELNSIFKKQDKHILINYIYDYPTFSELWAYSNAVISEMLHRNFNVNMHNYVEFFHNKDTTGGLRYKEHDGTYLVICYYNLKEKYLRGQKDFTQEIYKNLVEFYFVKGVEHEH